MEETKKDSMVSTHMWLIKPTIVFFVLLLVFCLGVEFGKHNLSGGRGYENFGNTPNMFYRYNQGGMQTRSLTGNKNPGAQRNITPQNTAGNAVQGQITPDSNTNPGNGNMPNPAITFGGSSTDPANGNNTISPVGNPADKTAPASN
jgi:hypothetical protein